MTNLSLVTPFVIACLVAQGCGPYEPEAPSNQEAGPVDVAMPALFTGTVDLTGEWGVQWTDPVTRYTEVFYIFVTNKNDTIAGNALDPALRPASVAGSIVSNHVTFTVHPWSGGAPSRTLPISIFSGHLTATNSMVGRWELDRPPRSRGGSSGGWKANQTASGTNRTVTVAADTKLMLVLTEEQFDYLFNSLFPDPPPHNTFDDHRNWYLGVKKSKKVGSHYEVEMAVGSLVGMHKSQTEMHLNSTMGREVVRAIEDVLHKNGFPFVWGP